MTSSTYSECKKTQVEMPNSLYIPMTLTLWGLGLGIDMQNLGIFWSVSQADRVRFRLNETPWFKNETNKQTNECTK